MYIPPFKISAHAINLIADISAMIERFAIRMERDDALLLRKINRVKTIQGSLAIEGNTLTESQITDIIDGKHVIAPIREIQEVRNAIKTYNLYSDLDPYSVKDLLSAHKTMMEALIDDAGHFRRSGVGVFSGTKAIHVAPPAQRVPTLISELFEWLKDADDHLLIKSCVFHYEFEFIHPFSDGNGRIGRLWQSLILGKLHPVFEHLPIENMVHTNQQGYYDAINRSTEATDSGIFVNFMLQEIYNTLENRQGDPISAPIAQEIAQEITQEKILNAIRNNPHITRRELSALSGRTEDSIKYILQKLTRQGIIKHIGPTKGGEWIIL